MEAAHDLDQEEDDEREPKLYVDVNVASFGLQRIIVYEGDTVDSLVNEFVQRCPIDAFMIEKLKNLLQQQIDGVLERIDDDEDEDLDDEDEKRHSADADEVDEDIIQPEEATGEIEVQDQQEYEDEVDQHSNEEAEHEELEETQRQRAHGEGREEQTTLLQESELVNTQTQMVQPAIDSEEK